jgi:hypothetical protein
MQLSFLINRLLRMSLPEICHRSRQTLQAAGEYLLRSYYARRLRITHFNKQECDQLFTTLPRITFEPATIFTGKSREELLARADRIVAQKLDVLALKGCDVGPEIDYHRDYSSGKRAP